jgi:hypothetical protein
MAFLRPLDIRVNVATSRVVNSTGNNVATRPRFLLGMHLVRLTLVDDANAAVPLQGNQEFYFGIDNVFTSGHADLCSAIHSAFVQADWNEWALAGGKVCGRLNTNTPAMKTALGTQGSATMYLGFWVTDPETGESQAFEIPVEVINAAVSLEDPAESEGVTYVDTSLLGLVIEQYTRPDGVKAVRIKNADGVTVLDAAP